jgi:beta-phosphoglucomutase-like phosphatase (HAD superfamily)
MTSPARPGSDLDTIVSRTRHLLLDFDGPVCSIFAGLPAATIASRLRKILGDHAQLPGQIARTEDPFAVFAYAATISEDLAARVEAEMTGQELTAVPTATPTPYVHEVVTACQNTGRSIAVVSNNSARTVHAYLTRHGLDDRIGLVIARTSPDPRLLKPSPYLITQAMDALDAEPGQCALVGDSVTDIQAAHLASVHSIGYANQPGMRERFAAAGVGATIDSLAELALGLRARVANPELLQLSLRRFQGRTFGAPGLTAPGVNSEDEREQPREKAARVTRRRRPGFTRGSRRCGAAAFAASFGRKPYGAASCRARHPR